MSRIVIREVDIRDLTVRNALLTLIHDSFVPGTITKRYKPHTNGHWWMGFSRGEPVAFAGLVPSHQWANTGYMTLSGVLPASRGHGLQRRLISKRIQKAKSLGWDTLVTETIHDNAPSMRSLIGCGFRPYTPRKPWGHKTAVYWRRKI